DRWSPSREGYRTRLTVRPRPTKYGRMMDGRLFTPEERRIIDRNRTPEQVQRFLRRLPYNWERDGDTLPSFPQVARLHTAHCLEAALVAAVVLEQRAWPPLFVSFSCQKLVCHLSFLVFP